MERHCGKIQRAVKGRRHIWAAIDNYVLRSAQVAHIKLRFNLDSNFASAPPPVPAIFRLTGQCTPPFIPISIAGSPFADSQYILHQSPTCELGSEVAVNEPGLFASLCGAIRTRLGTAVRLADIKTTLRGIEISDWPRLSVDNEGDTVAASWSPRENDLRDKTFCRVSFFTSSSET
jgi:hypothetical protein